MQKQLALPALALVASGCAQVTHSAAVEPGFGIDLTAGHGTARVDGGDAPHEPMTVLQVNGRYGWRLRGGTGLMLTLMLPFIWYRGSGTGSNPQYAAAADVYWQLGEAPDLGLGIVGSLDFTRGYAMWGRGWKLGEDVRLRLDGRVEAGAGLGPARTSDLVPTVHALMGAGATARFVLGPWSIGVWTNGTWAPFGYQTPDFGETRALDRVAWTGFVGGLIELRFSETEFEPRLH